MKKYKVAEIYEMDFGCEGRAKEVEDMVHVRLCSAAGENVIIQALDASLYEQDITEGSEVLLVGGKLEKCTE